ncbi:MAG: class I SAM-dependent methyltransferase [Pirellulaceae bacterium]|jgi:hypothetical protein|nr:class I SAM-dependent methyltransferase [Pirellulaceae bacterium]MDP7014783.1 class I SAM-dependent methyltransferase [Pirellulaceae bacterium]
MTVYQPGWRKLADLPNRLARRWRRRGARDAIGWSCHQAAWRLREWRLGINTRERAYGLETDDEGERHCYEPMDYKCLDILLDYFQSQNSGALLDYGCGMGRVVVQAALRPFSRVEGVEYSEPLAKIARRHLALTRPRWRTERANIKIADATSYALRDDVQNVVLFNSFTGHVLAKTLEQVRQSALRSPRELLIAYMIPRRDANALADHSWLVEVAQLPTAYWDHVRCFIYRCELDSIQTSTADTVSLA